MYATMISVKLYDLFLKREAGVYEYKFIKRNYTLETVFKHEENEIFIFKFYMLLRINISQEKKP